MARRECGAKATFAWLQNSDVRASRRPLASSFRWELSKKTNQKKKQNRFGVKVKIVKKKGGNMWELRINKKRLWWRLRAYSSVYTFFPKVLYHQVLEHLLHTKTIPTMAAFLPLSLMDSSGSGSKNEPPRCFESPVGANIISLYRQTPKNSGKAFVICLGKIPGLFPEVFFYDNLWGFATLRRLLLDPDLDGDAAETAGGAHGETVGSSFEKWLRVAGGWCGVCCYFWLLHELLLEPTPTKAPESP